MANLATMQRYAEKCAEKLGITDKVTLRWHGGDCVLHKRHHNAHCHICDGDAYPRGTICIRPGTWRLKSVKDWHYLIAHEVAHLATKCNHSSVTFARRMVALGQADSYEKGKVRASRRHKCRYTALPFQHCTICYKIKPVKT